MPKTIMCLLALAAFSFFFAANAVTAQDPSAADPDTPADEDSVESEKDHLVATWEALVKASDGLKELRAQLRSDLRAKKLTKEEADAKWKTDWAAFTEIQSEFIDATAKAKWKDYAEKHNAMLDEGLYMLAGRQSSNGEHPSAAKTYGAHLELCPTAKRRLLIQCQRYPQALVAAGKLDLAIKRVSEFIETAADNLPYLLLTLGDLQSAACDSDAALRTYAKLQKEIGARELDRKDPLNAVEDAASTRQKLVGKHGPRIEDSTWVGAEAKAIPDLKGSIVVLSYCDIWEAKCRNFMRRQDDLHKQHKAAGLIIVGVTVNSGPGFKPSNKADLEQGEVIQSIKKEEYAEHIGEFRKLADISYPFLLAGLFERMTYKFFKNAPAWVVLNREGKVVLWTQGATNESLVEACVNKLLAEKSTVPDKNPSDAESEK